MSSPASSDALDRITETIGANTDLGVVMGTVGYVSPEQRSRGSRRIICPDVFSLGVILRYELLVADAGRFTARCTAVETMWAILKEKTFRELPDRVSTGLRQVVSHCLEKEPENRFQSARDLSFALPTMSRSSGGAGSSSGATKALPAPSPWRKRAVIAAALLVLVAMSVAGDRLLWHTPEAQEWSGGILGGPEMALDLRMSPDGSLLAFQAVDRSLYTGGRDEARNRQLVDPDT